MIELMVPGAAPIGKHDGAWRMLIGGHLVDAVDGSTLDAVNPARGTVIGQVPAGSAADVDRAVDAAAAAAAAWRDKPIGERAATVAAIADVVEDHGDELALLDTLDGGNPVKVMSGDVRIAAEHLRYYAGLALQLRGETIPTPDSDSVDFTLREPYGVVGRIVPFNHPVMFAASRIAAPLVAGNTVVLKPSEHTSLSALRLGELLADIVPPGVVNVVTGLGGVVGDRLVTHPDVRRIAFTGGVEVGRHIQARAASAAVKTVTLELGGKNPMVVFHDADVDAAIDGAVRGMNFTWLGQSCGSTSRLFVHRSLYDQVVQGVAQRIDRLVLGDPQDPATDVGAVAYRQQYDKVLRYLELGETDPAATMVTGGLPDEPPHPDGLYVRPTLFAVDRYDDAAIASEEIFGPILCALAFDDDDDVVSRANASPFGLTASIWTTNLSRAIRTARAIEAGYVWVNWSSSHLPGTPFGGVKDSGVGREEGIEELLGYTQSKNLYIRY